MNIYVSLSKEDGKPEFVEVEMKDGHVTTITDLHKIAKVIWPDTNIDRIWLSPAKVMIGMRLTNIDIKHPG